MLSIPIPAYDNIQITYCVMEFNIETLRKRCIQWDGGLGIVLWCLWDVFYNNTHPKVRE